MWFLVMACIAGCLCVDLLYVGRQFPDEVDRMIHKFLTQLIVILIATMVYLT